MKKIGLVLLIIGILSFIVAGISALMIFNQIPGFIPIDINSLLFIGSIIVSVILVSLGLLLIIIGLYKERKGYGHRVVKNNVVTKPIIKTVVSKPMAKKSKVHFKQPVVVKLKNKNITSKKRTTSKINKTVTNKPNKKTTKSKTKNKTTKQPKKKTIKRKTTKQKSKQTKQK